LSEETSDSSAFLNVTCLFEVIYSRPDLVRWDLWLVNWRCGRFYPSTFVSPANLHSTKSSQSRRTGKVGQKWPTCRVHPVWTPPPTMRIWKYVLKMWSAFFKFLDPDLLQPDYRGFTIIQGCPSGVWRNTEDIVDRPDSVRCEKETTTVGAQCASSNWY
jgi:hypothetical protein